MTSAGLPDPCRAYSILCPLTRALPIARCRACQRQIAKAVAAAIIAADQHNTFRCIGGCSSLNLRRRQLKPSGDYTWHGDILVYFLPAQSVAIEFQHHLLQLFIRRGLEPLEPGCRETDDPSIGKLNVDHPFFCPCTQRCRLGRNRGINERGTHGISWSTTLDARTPNARFHEGHVREFRGSGRETPIRAKICTRCPIHEHEAAHWVRQNRNENGTDRCVRQSALKVEISGQAGCRLI